MNNSNTGSIELTELKKQREQQNLTVQTVADGMKVRKDFVHFIESGEFEKLGAPTFVRGHVSNYCKCIGIEPAKILAQVPKQHLEHQQLKSSNALGSSPLSHVKHQSSHFGRYAVGTALLSMLCMSFYFVWDKWSLPVDTGTAEMDRQIALKQQGFEASGKKKVTYSSMIPQVSEPIGGVRKETELISADETYIEIDDLGDEALNENMSEDETGFNDENKDLNADGQPDELSTVKLSDDNEQSLLAATSLDTSSELNKSGYSIVMEFEEQAWVSIKTLSGEKIIQDLLGPGLSEIQVSEPVHFRIGNANKAALIINDNAIELQPFIKQDVADFDWPLEPNS